MVSRIDVEKKPGFDVEAQQLLQELHTVITEGLPQAIKLRIINMYDVEGIADELFNQCVPTVFSEPQVDNASFELPVEGVLMGAAGSGKGVLEVPEGVSLFAVEPLPGQFDHRADPASECIQLISQGERPTVRSVKIYVLEGSLSDEALEAIKHYVINPIESREASLALRDTLAMQIPEPQPVEVVEGFIDLDEAGLAQFLSDRGLAMDLADITFSRSISAKPKSAILPLPRLKLWIRIGLTIVATLRSVRNLPTLKLTTKWSSLPLISI